MSDDFFSNVHFGRSNSEIDVHDDFAQAISVRFGSTDLRTARLLPGDLPPSTPHRPTRLSLPQQPQPPPRPPSPRHSFSSVLPSALPPFLTDPRSLILDIRPHAAHAAARINNALPLSVPTTLLKRPLFSLSKLSQMLPSPSSRARFANWPSASCILVYDSDSTCSPDSSIIAGLLRKFRAEGFSGELAWVRGGFQAVWKEARDLATTEPPSPEEDDSDAASSSGTLRTTYLPRAAFSLSSTTVAPPSHLAAVPGSLPLLNTPAPSASRAANPFFDTIRQNVELSHGITERIPLRLPRRVRRRIPDLPSRWLQDIARRSALRFSSASRHPGLDGLESGSDSDDPHTSDPDENDPDVEEGAEALAMQFYRIELAEQRRLRSIMEHHTRESQVSAFVASAKPRKLLQEDGSGVGMRTGAKSFPGTPHLAVFPFSITAAVEKGTKNRSGRAVVAAQTLRECNGDRDIQIGVTRMIGDHPTHQRPLSWCSSPWYTHIWPFEHARVRLHDSRHQGSHSSRRDKDKATERCRSTRDRSGGKGRGREEKGRKQDTQPRSRSSPAYGKSHDKEVTQVFGGSSRHSFYFDARSSISSTGTSVGIEVGLTLPTLTLGPNIPQVKIEYDTTEQDSRMSGPPTPATALPLSTPPFYIPMEILPAPTPMRLRPPPLLSPSGVGVDSGDRLGGPQVALPTPSLPYLGSFPSFPLRLPNHSGGLLSRIGEQTHTSELLSSPVTSLGGPVGRLGTDREVANNTGWMRERREPSPVDDYVNASYVQPLCTRKRYIATQGPLPSTYTDFWTLVWEQNVHVIVMLTREVENAMVKCGSYWTDTEYGPLRLQLLSTSPPISPANPTTPDTLKQGFFAIREPQGKHNKMSRVHSTLITRTFLLGHSSYPGIPPRKITHLQYLDWSDMNVPDDPRDVLDLMKKVEQAVVESTPGPSPSGSLSPASGSGSVSECQSPDVASDQRGHDMLLSPTSAGVGPWGGRGRHGNEWRHPELDSKSGIASFALGKASPVLLHCSAGVGRTGGFIAVDAVLDGIKSELRNNREERLKVASKVSAVGSPEGKAKFIVENIETGINALDSFGVDESGLMDVDEPTTGRAEKARDALQMINTVPIHVSAGNREKGRRCHSHGGDLSAEKQSLVVHVPYAGISDMSEGTNAAGVDLDNAKEADWQSSTREWVERVSDQTRAPGQEGPPPPPPLPPLSRERSPGSTSTSSGPSALNSADESTNGSANADASGSAVSGNGNRVEQKSNAGSTTGSGSGSGSARLSPSSVSKPGSGSISLSTSGSGTGTGSQFGSSLLRVRLRDSSVTSISAESTDSFSPPHEPKLNIDRPPVFHTSSNSEMEIDCLPPRPVSVPLQTTHLSTVDTARSYHDKPLLGLLPVPRFSSPILPQGMAERGASFFGSDAAEGPTSLPSSVLGSDDLATPSQELESGESADAEGYRDASQGVQIVIPSRPGINLRLNTELSVLKAPEMFHSDDADKNSNSPPLPRQIKSKERTITTLETRPFDDSQSPTAGGAFGSSDQVQHDYPVIDYKLPRELHGDLSPPLISSLTDPVCVVIQDMREQRMSLCQSLRQYVFVHAAIIEGALRIVDEERELWGDSRASDDSSSAEGEPGASVRKHGLRSGDSEAEAWASRADVVAMRPELLHRGTIPHKNRSLHTVAQPPNTWSLEGTIGGGQAPLGPTSSPSGVSSPSKGKRAPSPTELLREDKTGALTLNKRPSINRKRTSDEGDQFSFETRRSSPVASGNGGGSRDAAVGASGARFALGRLVVPETGCTASSGTR